MAGGVGWYRKDFTLPSKSAALQWIVRFESVNYRSQGVAQRPRRGHATAAPTCRSSSCSPACRRTGTNRLVVRVDSRRGAADFPPAGISQTGVPAGGWWNYSGILREVYLRRVDTVDFEQVVVRPQLACRDVRRARDDGRARAQRHAARRARVTVTGRYGGRPVALGTRRAARPGDRALRRRADAARPAAVVAALAGALPRRARGARGRPARRRLSPAQRDQVGRGCGATGGCCSTATPCNLRGVGYHEDDRENGSAIGTETRERLIAETKALGATLMRTHYPPHPQLQELADREGILLWSEIPVYSVDSGELDRPSVRALAVRELARNIAANQNHASVLLWSVGNELNAKPGPGIGAYFTPRRGAPTAWTRPGRSATRPRPTSRPAASGEYAPLDVIGFNEYFGWYTGPGGQIFDRTRLSGYLDSIRRCYPHQALLVSEFGAEANRDGPAEEKGTWAFQQDFVRYHLGVFATKPWLNGAIYWALNEFRVRPALGGRQPAARPAPAPEGAAALRHVGAQARLGGRGAALQGRQAVRLGTRGRGAGCGARRAGRGCASASRPWPRRRMPGGLGVGQRDAPGRARLGPRGEPVVAASAAALVVLRRRPRGVGVRAQEHHEEHDPEGERDEVQDAEDDHQLLVGRHDRMLPRRRGRQATISLACAAAHGRFHRQLRAPSS